MNFHLSLATFLHQSNPTLYPVLTKRGYINTGMDLLRMRTTPSPGQMGCRGVKFFIIKQKNVGDLMKYTLYTTVIDEKFFYDSATLKCCYIKYRHAGQIRIIFLGRGRIRTIL